MNCSRFAQVSTDFNGAKIVSSIRCTVSSTALCHSSSFSTDRAFFASFNPNLN